MAGTRNADDEQRYPLADLIHELGAQLREAQRRASADGLPGILRLRECTVEMGVTWTKTGSGGIEFWVVKLGGDVSKENTQTITLTLEPAGDDELVLEE